MEELERVRVSSFLVEYSLTLKEVEDLVAKGDVERFILPVDKALDKYKAVYATKELDKLLHNGNGFSRKMLPKDIDLSNGEQIRMYDSDGEFIGIYKIEGINCKLVKMFYEKNNIQ